MSNQENSFVGFEYLEVCAKRGMESMYNTRRETYAQGSNPRSVSVRHRRDFDCPPAPAQAEGLQIAGRPSYRNGLVHMRQARAFSYFSNKTQIPAKHRGGKI